MGRSLNRRDFLKGTAAAATALSLPLAPLGRFAPLVYANNTDDPTVIVVRDAAAHSGSQLVPGVVQVMMDEAIRRFTGINDLGEAYLSLFPGITTSSVIGIKINSTNGLLPTHPVAVTALTNGLQKMNIGGTFFPANNIIIWDRTTWELTNSGFTLNMGTTGVRCFATNSSGVGYSTRYLNCYGSQQHPSNILAEYCDYLIDFAVLKNHSWAGITLTLKNHLGSVHNPSGLHGGYCANYVPALNQQIRDVLEVQESLFLLDAIFGEYSGGPGGSPNMVYDGIILAQDRVAVDAIGRSILQSYGCPTIGLSTHVDVAAGAPYYLGTANLSQINRVDVTNPSQAVENLTVAHNDLDVILSWSSPEYTGSFNVLRSPDPDFAASQIIATVSGGSYTDPGILASSTKYFYRIVKIW